MLVKIINVEDEIGFYFKGKNEYINAETFSCFLLQISDVLRNIGEIIDPGSEIQVYIDSIEKGSLKFSMKVKNDKQEFGMKLDICKKIIWIFVFIICVSFAGCASGTDKDNRLLLGLCG